MFDAALASALRTQESFLPGDADRHRVMDAATSLFVFSRSAAILSGCGACANGIDRVAELLRDISPEFERSDVCAQLLRVRLAAHHLGAVSLDETAAGEEAERVAGYQARSDDARLDGGFWFGRKRGEHAPYMNPVSTAFSLQALAREQQRAGIGNSRSRS